MVLRKVFLGEFGGVTGTVVLDQINTFGVAMGMTKILERFDIVLRIVLRYAMPDHLPTVDIQVEQHIDGAMADVFELRTPHQPWSSRPGRTQSFQRLDVGFFVDADDQITIGNKAFDVLIAPEDLLGPVLKLLIDTGRFPIFVAVRLKVDGFENVMNGAVMNRFNDPLFDHHLS